MKFKYVMTIVDGLETPIIFPPWIQHDSMAMGKEVVGAGFVEFNNAEVFVSGRSQSLGLVPHENDASILSKYVSMDLGL